MEKKLVRGYYPFNFFLSVRYMYVCMYVCMYGGMYVGM